MITNDNKPLFLQIKAWIEDHILRDEWQSGSQLPSVRELSAVLGLRIVKGDDPLNVFKSKRIFCEIKIDPTSSQNAFTVNEQIYYRRAIRNLFNIKWPLVTF